MSGGETSLQHTASRAHHAVPHRRAVRRLALRPLFTAVVRREEQRPAHKHPGAKPFWLLRLKAFALRRLCPCSATTLLSLLEECNPDASNLVATYSSVRSG